MFLNRNSKEDSRDYSVGAALSSLPSPHRQRAHSSVNPTKQTNNAKTNKQHSSVNPTKQTNNIHRLTQHWMADEQTTLNANKQERNNKCNQTALNKTLNKTSKRRRQQITSSKQIKHTHTHTQNKLNAHNLRQKASKHSKNNLIGLVVIFNVYFVCFCLFVCSFVCFLLL